MDNRPSLESIFGPTAASGTGVSVRPSLASIFGQKDDNQPPILPVIPPPSDGGNTPPTGGAPTNDHDVRKSLISGVTHSLPDLANNVAAFGNTAIEYARGGDRKFQNFAGKGNELTTKIAGEDYQPQTMAGRYAKAVGTGVGAAPLGFTGWAGAGRGLVSGLFGGVGSEAGGDVAAGVGGEDKRIYGQIVGGGIAGLKSDKAAKELLRGYEGMAPKLNPIGKELRAGADASYKSADEAGIAFDKKHFRNFVNQAKSDAEGQGIDSELNPGTTRLLTRFNDELKGNDPLTLTKVENLRKVTMNVSPQNPSDYRLAARLRDSLDDFVDNAESSGALVAGDAKGIGALKEARGQWKQLRKNEVIDDIFKKEGATNQTIKQGLRSLANNKRRFSQFSKTEQDAIRKGARTGVIEQTLRGIGQLDPTNNRIASGAGIAATVMNPAGAALPVAGFAANRGAQALASRSANAARMAVRQAGGKAPTAFEQAGQKARSAFGLSAPVPPSTGIPNLGGSANVNQALPAAQPITRSPNAGSVNLNSRPEAALLIAGLGGVGVTGGAIEGGRQAYLKDEADRMAQTSEPMEPMVNGGNNSQPDELGALIQQQTYKIAQGFSHENFVDGLTNGVESNGDRNAKNPRSSALGPYQMIRSTFASAVKKYDPETYKKGNFQQLRTNPEYARSIAIKLQEENAAALEKKGIPVNETTSYLAWFANPQKTAQLLSSPANAPASSVFSKAELEANPFLKSKNVGQIVQWANKKGERIAGL